MTDNINNENIVSDSFVSDNNRKHNWKKSEQISEKEQIPHINPVKLISDEQTNNYWYANK